MSSPEKDGGPRTWLNSPAGTDRPKPSSSFLNSHSLGNPPPMTTTLILCALLASGLALALSREHRIRRAFQALANRVLAKLHERSRAGFISHPQHHTRPPHSRRRS